MTARSGFCSNFAFCFPSCGTGNGRFRVVVLFEPWMFAFNCPRRPSNYRFALLLRPMFPLPTALILSKAGGCCSFTTRCSAEELPASIFEGGWQEPLVSFNFTRRHSVSVRQHACAPPCFYMRLTCLSTTRQLNNVHPPASSLRTVSGFVLRTRWLRGVRESVQSCRARMASPSANLERRHSRPLDRRSIVRQCKDAALGQMRSEKCGSM